MPLLVWLKNGGTPRIIRGMPPAHVIVRSVFTAGCACIRRHTGCPMDLSISVNHG